MKKSVKAIRPKWLPERVYVGPDSYEVKLVNMYHCGETSSNPLVIKIKPGMSPRETINTFIHECLHAGCFSGELPESKIKHKRIYELADFFTNLLIDNFFLDIE